MDEIVIQSSFELAAAHIPNASLFSPWEKAKFVLDALLSRAGVASEVNAESWSKTCLTCQHVDAKTVVAVSGGVHRLGDTLARSEIPVMLTLTTGRMSSTPVFAVYAANDSARDIFTSLWTAARQLIPALTLPDSPVVTSCSPPLTLKS